MKNDNNNGVIDTSVNYTSFGINSNEQEEKTAQGITFHENDIHFSINNDLDIAQKYISGLTNIEIFEKTRRDKGKNGSRSIFKGLSPDSPKMTVEHDPKKQYPKGKYGKVKKIYSDPQQPAANALKIEKVSLNEYKEKLNQYNNMVDLAKKMNVSINCWVRMDQFKKLFLLKVIKIYTMMPWYKGGTLLEDMKKVQNVLEKNSNNKLGDALQRSIFLKQPISERIKAVDYLLEQLNTIHKAGFAMNDLKPENIMIDNGRLYLIDLDSCQKIGQDNIITTEGYYQKDYSSKKNDAYAFRKILLHCFPDVFYFTLKNNPNPLKANEYAYLIHNFQDMKNSLYPNLKDFEDLIININPNIPQKFSDPLADVMKKLQDYVKYPYEKDIDFSKLSDIFKKIEMNQASSQCSDNKSNNQTFFNSSSPSNKGNGNVPLKVKSNLSPTGI